MFVYQPQGIRLDKSSLSAGKHQEFITKSSSSINGDDQGLSMATDEVSAAGTMIIEKRRLISSHGHWLPKIHEDYYGPRYHLPRHH
ncbi:hypothetical protein OSB04_015027 [Centaurea solstitialis]|uniref:Uncharacterized protein n=1 Tax=Centaurea solstitialis TaxID=347529 RepID=A0AA38W8J3_9ASTR|nr:hypothetical protein OSB04_015027 [Centaurea solstitialis]